MRELTIDWAALHSAFQMNMPEVRCFLAVEDGRVLKLPPGDPSLTAVRGDPNRFIAIEAVPSRIQYQWLADFIATVGEGEARNRMEAAINGKGAFRRFKDILLTLPEERRRWFEYRDQMMRQRIVEWVREQGIVPENPAPWTTGEAYVGLDPDGFPFSARSPGNGTEAYPAVGAEAAAASSIQLTRPPATGLDVHNTIHHAAPAYAAPSAQQVPDNVGNVAPAGHGGRLGRQAPPKNNPHEIEALRDFLIEWSDAREKERAPGPLELEELAGKISKHFHLQSLHL